jgi:hypothetical protein
MDVLRSQAAGHICWVAQEVPAKLENLRDVRTGRDVADPQALLFYTYVRILYEGGWYR